MGSFKAHILKRRDSECRAPPCGAMEDEAFFLREDLLVIGALRIHPELDHAAWAMNAARNEPELLTFTHVSQIYEHHIRVSYQGDGSVGVDFLNPRLGFGDHVGR